MKKIKLPIKVEKAITEMMDDVEGMLGCAESIDGEPSWDDNMNKRIKIIKKFFSNNK